MLKRLIQRLIRPRQDQAAPDAWVTFLAADMRGLTKFQHASRASLETGLGPLPLEMKGGKERYLTGPLPVGSATLFLYEDGAEISAPGIDWRAERWDYETPAALITELVARAQRGGAI